MSSELSPARDLGRWLGEKIEAPDPIGALAFPLRATFRAGGFVARDARTSRTSASTRCQQLVHSFRSSLWTPMWTTWGGRGVSLWMSAPRRGTRLWTVLGKARCDAAGLHRCCPPVVDNKFLTGGTLVRPNRSVIAVRERQ